jgi:hypothetical protein
MVKLTLASNVMLVLMAVMLAWHALILILLSLPAGAAWHVIVTALIILANVGVLLEGFVVTLTFLLLLEVNSVKAVILMARIVLISVHSALAA